MEGTIKYLERKIEGCDAIGGMEREKAVYQSVLKEVRKQESTIHSELEKKDKAITDLSNCLEGSTQFLDRLIKDGAIDEESLIFAFIKTQIESNRITLNEGKK